SPTSSPAAGTDPADMRTWRASRSTASRSNAEAESIRRKPKVNPSLRSIGIVAAALMSIGALAPAHSQQGRPPPALGDGPWDLQTETGMGPRVRAHQGSGVAMGPRVPPRRRHARDRTAGTAARDSRRQARSESDPRAAGP